MPINELKKEFPDLTDKDLENMSKQGYQNTGFYNRSIVETTNIDRNQVQEMGNNFKD